MTYEKKWNQLENILINIINDQLNMDFESSYRLVYEMCTFNYSKNIDKLTKDLIYFFNKNNEKLNDKNIKCIDDILMFYRIKMNIKSLMIFA